MVRTGKNERIKRQYTGMESDAERIRFLEDFAVLRYTNRLSQEEIAEFDECVKDFFSPVYPDGRPQGDIFEMRMAAYHARRMELQIELGKNFRGLKEAEPSAQDEKIRDMVSYSNEYMFRMLAMDRYVMVPDMMGEEYKRDYAARSNVEVKDGPGAVDEAFREAGQKIYDATVFFATDDEEETAILYDGQRVVDQHSSGDRYLTDEERRYFDPVRASHLSAVSEIAMEGKSFRDPSAFIDQDKLEELDDLYNELVKADRRTHINSGRYNDLVKKLSKIHDYYMAYKDTDLAPEAEVRENIQKAMDELQDSNEVYLESKEALKNPGSLDSARRDISRRIRKALNPGVSEIKARQKAIKEAEADLDEEVRNIEGQLAAERAREKAAAKQGAKAEAPKAEVKAEAKVEGTKVEAPKAEVKAEGAKVQEKKEAPKAEGVKAEAAKAEAPKAEAKAEGTKASEKKESVKAEAPKAPEKKVRSFEISHTDSLTIEGKGSSKRLSNNSGSVSVQSSSGKLPSFSISSAQKESIAGDYRKISGEIKKNPEFRKNEDLKKVEKSVDKLASVAGKSDVKAAGTVILNVARIDNAINSINNKGEEISKETGGVITDIRDANDRSLNIIAGADNTLGSKDAISQMKVQNAIASLVANTSNEIALKDKAAEVKKLSQEYGKIEKKIDALDTDRSVKKDLLEGTKKLSEMKPSVKGGNVIENVEKLSDSIDRSKDKDKELTVITEDLKKLNRSTVKKAGEWIALDKKIEMDAQQDRNRREMVRNLERNAGINKKKTEIRTGQKKTELDKRIEARRKRLNKKSDGIKKGLERFKKDAQKNSNNIQTKKNSFVK